MVVFFNLDDIHFLQLFKNQYRPYSNDVKSFDFTMTIYKTDVTKLLETYIIGEILGQPC